MLSYFSFLFGPSDAALVAEIREVLIKLRTILIVRKRRDASTALVRLGSRDNQIAPHGARY